MADNLHVGSHINSCDNYDNMRWFTPWFEAVCAYLHGYEPSEKMCKDLFDSGMDPRQACYWIRKREETE